MNRFENCLYRDVCDYDTECKKACPRYSITKYMLENSNIPKSLWKVNKLEPEDCDIKAFETLSDIRENIVDFVKGGNSLYLYSETCGNGKTTWAIKLALQYINDVWEHTGYNVRVIFVNVPWFFNMCKSIISYPDEAFNEFKNNIYTVDLVIWDEVSAKYLSAYEYDMLYHILEHRITNGKANIYTGNSLIDKLSLIMDPKLVSRITKGAKIQLKGGDRRNGTTSNSFSNINI